MSASHLLEVRDLSTRFVSQGRQVDAVKNVSFTVDRGETLCLVGESGSGKSVSALSIIQLLPRKATTHPSGEVWLDVHSRTAESHPVEMLHLDEGQRRRIRGSNIAMIFQEPMSSLNPVFSIGEQISEALLLHNPSMSQSEALERAELALEQVKIRKARARLRDYPHQLSGGQRQRVMIAMAMACEPDLLIADEPTTALDVTVQAEILALMRDLQQESGMGILFITHDFGVVSRMADRVAVMRKGQIVEQAKLNRLLTAPSHEYTQGLLEALPENLPRVITQPVSFSQNSILSVENLKVYFPVRKGVFRRVVDQIKAVDGVSLDIYRGEIVALVGESGCGKSTLGKAILQLLEPTSGDVLVEGQSIIGLSREAMLPFRRRLQVIFQDPMSSLNPRLTIATALTEPMKVHQIGGSDEERLELAAEVLERVHLERDHLWRYPHEFSGGQRQRIGIARALVLKPEFIVCDEITSGLDVSIQAEILQLLMSLREEQQLALLFITHDIGVVEYISDRTVVMRQGQVVEQGKTMELCRRPEQDYTRHLLEAVPRVSDVTGVVG